MFMTRFDPFTEFDRLFGSASVARGLPMDLYRRGDEYIVELDVPGLDPQSIDVTVERNVLQVTADRKPTYGEGDHIFVAERPKGSIRRQILLGNDVDGGAVSAAYDDGVLTIHVPVAETAKPHKIEIGAGNGQKTLAAQSA